MKVKPSCFDNTFMKQNANKDTALLLFSLSASREAERKPLFGHNNKQVSNNFFSLLIKETAQLAEASGADVFWIDEKQQRGTDFASRFTNAFKDLYAKGYNNVLSIGNDCPELTLGRLNMAIDQLRRNKMVVGPAADGGVYLIGFPKEQFESKTFEALSWQQNTLFEEIVQNSIDLQLPFYALDALADIDSPKDMLAFAEKVPVSVLAVFIKNNLQRSKRAISTNVFTDYHLFYNTSLPARAPPFFLMAA